MMARCRVICYIRKPDWTILVEALDDINELSPSEQRSEDELQRNVLKYVVMNRTNYIVNVHNFLSIQTVCVDWQCARASETVGRISGEFKFEKQSWKSHLLNSDSKRPDGKNWFLIGQKDRQIGFPRSGWWRFWVNGYSLSPTNTNFHQSLSWQRRM